MKIKKIVIACGIYNEREKQIFVSFDENDKAVDIFDLGESMVSRVFLASVEKVLKDIDASILKIKDSNNKAFIENKKLEPEYFLVKHSQKQPVSQADEFYVKITQDRKANKPYSCTFARDDSTDCGKYSILFDYLKNYQVDDIEILSDSAELIEYFPQAKLYNDDDLSLWNLYGFTGILDDALKESVFLKNNSNIVIESTEALTSVDVNSKTIQKNFSSFDINVMAAGELVRQLRLRNISGIIIADLLKPMDENQQQEIIKVMKEAAADDYCRVDVHGFTRLGLLEITRSRKFTPLSEIFK